MRKTIFVLVIWILSSCGNNMNKEYIVTNDDSTASEYEIDRKDFTLENLVSERLKNYFELLKLKNEHPEFQEDILKQLKDFSKEGFIKTDSSNFSVENIRTVGETVVLSDSLKSMRLYYDSVSTNGIETDSIDALIMTKIILLDGIETKSTKISFLRIE
ncbi:hypothetical protein FEE95_14715 [Maribacter algarum]|uniref:Uncharacterized protein n=1 Tax=Maribacter algarum (ex Zhang et al. 2020) TaxID=2578118 RepID=A0A5S3PN47_9FLAO|nr:hypothetical protein [Maribacter algarum]TMM55898.1 hypothetical protein FEE95_14715 [Maribacter algarum]